MAFNIVELAAGTVGDNDCAFDQPCKHGHRVEGHAVYCHNDAWIDGPRKCCRTWYTSGEVRDEDCPGFQPNEQFKNTIGQPREIVTPCSDCGGAKLSVQDPVRHTVHTCDRCQGTGEEPPRMELSRWERYVLESCVASNFSHPFDENSTILSGAMFRLKEFPTRLLDEGLLDLRSVGCDGPATTHTVRLTRKGYAVLHQAWNQGRR